MATKLKIRTFKDNGETRAVTKTRRRAISDKDSDYPIAVLEMSLYKEAINEVDLEHTKPRQR